MAFPCWIQKTDVLKWKSMSFNNAMCKESYILVSFFGIFKMSLRSYFYTPTILSITHYLTIGAFYDRYSTFWCMGRLFLRLIAFVSDLTCWHWSSNTISSKKVSYLITHSTKCKESLCRFYIVAWNWVDGSVFQSYC